MHFPGYDTVTDGELYAKSDNTMTTLLMVCKAHEPKPYQVRRLVVDTAKALEHPSYQTPQNRAQWEMAQIPPYVREEIIAYNPVFIPSNEYIREALGVAKSHLNINEFTFPNKYNQELDQSDQVVFNLYEYLDFMQSFDQNNITSRHIRVQFRKKLPSMQEVLQRNAMYDEHPLFGRSMNSRQAVPFLHMTYSKLVKNFNKIKDDTATAIDYLAAMFIESVGDYLQRYDDQDFTLTPLCNTMLYEQSKEKPN